MLSIVRACFIILLARPVLRPRLRFISLIFNWSARCGTMLQPGSSACASSREQQQQQQRSASQPAGHLCCMATFQVHFNGIRLPTWWNERALNKILAPHNNNNNNNKRWAQQVNILPAKNEIKRKRRKKNKSGDLMRSIAYTPRLQNVHWTFTLAQLAVGRLALVLIRFSCCCYCCCYCCCFIDRCDFDFHLARIFW